MHPQEAVSKSIWKLPKSLEHLRQEMLSHPILPCQKVVLSIITYYFTIHATFRNFIFFPILFKYSILFLFFFFNYFSFSFPFPLFLPQPLAPVSTHRATYIETYDTPIHLSKPITTHTQTQTIKPSTEPHTHTNHQTNLYDVDMKPHLLCALIKDCIPDNKHPFKNPVELFAVVLLIKTHGLLLESFGQIHWPKACQ